MPKITELGYEPIQNRSTFGVYFSKGENVNTTIRALHSTPGVKIITFYALAPRLYKRSDQNFRYTHYAYIQANTRRDFFQAIHTIRKFI